MHSNLIILSHKTNFKKQKIRVLKTPNYYIPPGTDNNYNYNYTPAPQVYYQPNPSDYTTPIPQYQPQAYVQPQYNNQNEIRQYDVQKYNKKKNK